MGRRLHRLAVELAKFLAVGGAATLVAFVIFNVLVHGYFGPPNGPMHNQPLIAFAIANLIGMVISYRGARNWAFRHREVMGIAGGMARYFVINSVTLLIPLACLAFSRYVLKHTDPVSDNLAANVIGLVLGMGARFLLFRTFIFVHPERAAQLREVRG